MAINPRQRTLLEGAGFDEDQVAGLDSVELVAPVCEIISGCNAHKREADRAKEALNEAKPGTPWLWFVVTAVVCLLLGGFIGRQAFPRTVENIVPTGISSIAFQNATQAVSSAAVEAEALKKQIGDLTNTNGILEAAIIAAKADATRFTSLTNVVNELNVLQGQNTALIMSNRLAQSLIGELSAATNSLSQQLVARQEVAVHPQSPQADIRMPVPMETQDGMGLRPGRTANGEQVLLTVPAMAGPVEPPYPPQVGYAWAERPVVVGRRELGPQSYVPRNIWVQVPLQRRR